MATANAAPTGNETTPTATPSPAPAVVPAEPAAPAPVDPAVAAAAAAAAAASSSILDPEDSTAGALVVDQHVAVPRDAFRKIKDAAKERGKREAEAALLERAQAFGFPTVEALLEALKEDPVATTGAPNPNPTQPNTAPSSPPAPAPAPPPAAAAPPPPSSPPAPAPAPIAPPVPTAAPAAAAPANPVTPPAAPEAPTSEEPENDRRVPDAVRKKLQQARNEMKQRTAAAEQERDQYKVQAETAAAQLAQFKVEQTMREDMIRDGVKDMEFCWHALQQHLKALTDDKTPEGEAKLKAFDLKAWLAEQRKQRPYLFGEQVMPANTGVTTTAPTSPPPGTVTGAGGDATRVDARQLPPDEFRKRMASLGINVPHSGPPIPRR